jgi:hypothetical protein
VAGRFSLRKAAVPGGGHGFGHERKSAAEPFEMAPKW